MKHETHKKKTVSALKWNALNQLVTQTLTLGISILLMRLIEPEEFGLLGMVAVFTGFMGVMANFGLATSLLQKKNIDELDKNTVFYANLFVGLLLTSILFFGSGYIADFYNTPKLSTIAKFLSILFTTEAFGMVQSTMLRRELNYRIFFFANLFTALIGGILAVYLALHDYGVWTLVYKQLTVSIATTVLLWFIVTWHPRLLFSVARLKQHLKFSMPLFGTNTLNYWSRNADNLLIGKFLGAGALGLYSKAYALMMLPLNKISSVISSVMLSSFSLIQDDKERIKVIYLKISRVIAFITFPMMGILFVAAKPLVAFAFGEKWMGIVFLLKVFAFIGALQSIFTINGNIFISQGKTKLMFQLKIFTSIVVVIAFAIGVQFGVNAVAIAYLVAILINLVPELFFMGKLINLSINEIFKNLKTYLFVLLILTFTGLFFMSNISELSDIYKVMLITIFFGLGWVILIRIFNNTLLKEMLTILREIIKK